MKKFFSAKALFFIFIISQNVYAEKETATDNVHALATPTPENASKKYSASFREVEIKEFVATAAQILKKNIIIDPSITGQISVRSYDDLNENQYADFFINVMEAYGYSVVKIDNHTLNVVPQAQSLRAAWAEGNKGRSKNIVVRLARMNVLSGAELEPILGLIAENSAVKLKYYSSGNLFIFTGREDVVERLVDIVNQIDNARADSSPTVFNVSQAKASDIAKSLQSTFRNLTPEDKNAPLIYGNDATRTIMVKGGAHLRAEISRLISAMDVPGQQSRVFFLKYADAVQMAKLFTNNNNPSGSPEPAGGNTMSMEAMLAQQSPGSMSSGQPANLDGQAASGGTTPAADFSNDSNSMFSDGDTLVRQTRVHADRDNNALVVSAPPAAMQQAASIIQQLDVRHEQVLVEAIVVEVQKAEGLNLGIAWGNKNYGGSNFNSINVGNGFSQANPLVNALKGTEGLVAGFYHGNWGTLFNALESNKSNNIVATPSVVTLDNHRAEFNVGQDVPILTGSQTTNNDNIFNTVQRRTIGIKFSILPRINQSGTILLTISQEISSLSDTAQVNNNLGAVFNIRTVNNVVQVQDNETVVIGGLLDDEKKETVNKVPLLGDIPWLGNVFRYTSHNDDKRNLMLFIRPRIIRSDGAETVQARQGASSAVADEAVRNSPTTQNAPHAIERPTPGVNAILNGIQKFTMSLH
ncbi:type II secretion system protein GspD [Dickeya dianthicola]|uniref:Type II secretion system protein GspD n=3 Tax=Dickeya TaxID=204037 RepID=A0ABX9NNQ2_9GAMM|nr:type II secretion system secretin GspD [Dickeya dianthicola]MCI4030037.1 type II secretion system secretin GspD [Dickeya dianthicola]MCI4067737.1 type II secretion system secretin GspD [Dickeya dianthicola]MCI4115509.1 type II secretion system secretin GspD [Dickeya dianthicola]MCI4119338.1 type II secretion system secretin GspD [Dickeya dianthicola]MCI4123154.1 type II secretion system secretin GspD [Dickeya dianthicola]